MPKKKEVKKKKKNLGGQPRRFKTPKDLDRSFREYVKWVDDNPWYKNEPIKSGDLAGEIMKVPTQRPYTLTGFAAFCGVCLQTIENYGDRRKYPEYFGVYNIMNTTFTAQKFEGAAVGAFNPHIIARDLGLRDKQDHEVKIVDDNALDLDELKNMSEEDINRAVFDKLREWRDNESGSSKNKKR